VVDFEIIECCVCGSMYFVLENRTCIIFIFFNLDLILSYV